MAVAKLMVTPSLVAFDYFYYGRRTTLPQAVLLLLACAGIGLASVSDVQLHALGAAVATAAVGTAAAQKVLNSHVQQIGGLSSLQVMQNAFPAMTLLSLAYIPLLDRRLPLLLSLRWATAEALGYIFASALAAFAASWSATLIFGMLSALAHVLLGQVKTCSVIVAGALFYDASPTPRGITGASVALAAITGYSLLKLPGGVSGALCGGGGGGGGGGKVGAQRDESGKKCTGSDSASEDDVDEGRPLTSGNAR